MPATTVSRSTASRAGQIPVRKITNADANAALGLRALKHTAANAFVTYNLYDDQARVTPLAVNGTIGPFTADGTAQTVNVYGRAFGESGLIVGSYTDTIAVTLTF